MNKHTSKIIEEISGKRNLCNIFGVSAGVYRIKKNYCKGMTARNAPFGILFTIKGENGEKFNGKKICTSCFSSDINSYFVSSNVLAELKKYFDSVEIPFRTEKSEYYSL